MSLASLEIAGVARTPGSFTAEEIAAARQHLATRGTRTHGPGISDADRIAGSIIYHETSETPVLFDNFVVPWTVAKTQIEIGGAVIVAAIDRLFGGF